MTKQDINIYLPNILLHQIDHFSKEPLPKEVKQEIIKSEEPLVDIACQNEREVKESISLITSSKIGGNDQVTNESINSSGVYGPYGSNKSYGSHHINSRRQNLKSRMVHKHRAALELRKMVYEDELSQEMRRKLRREEQLRALMEEKKHQEDIILAAEAAILGIDIEENHPRHVGLLFSTR